MLNHISQYNRKEQLGYKKYVEKSDVSKCMNIGLTVFIFYPYGDRTTDPEIEK